MHNLKEIRKDFSKFEKDLEKRSVKIDFNNLKKLDELNRNLIQKKENLEKEKKDISKSKDESLFKKSKEISIELEKISEQQKNTKTELDNILSIDCEISLDLLKRVLSLDFEIFFFSLSNASFF